MNNPLLSARDIHKSFRIGPQSVHVLRGASLRVEPAEFLVITGSSGCGKSTLLHILGALDRPDRGTVEVEGQSIFALADARQRDYRNHRIGFVFQFYHLLPELTLLENVLVPAMVRCSWWQWKREKLKVIPQAEALIERIGLSHRIRHRPNELSGGERQRVAIARALILKPLLLLADEPTGNLDETIGADILRLLRELNQAGQSIVMVTHDPKVASGAHRRIHLTEGVIREVPKGLDDSGVTSLRERRKVAP